MKKLFLWGFLLLFVCGYSSLYAGTITFEGVPNQYLVNDLGLNLGNYWEGATFGPDVNIADTIRSPGYDNNYPPASGTSVAVNPAGESQMIIYFDSPVDSVSLKYSSSSILNLEAYDSNGDSVVTPVVGPPNVYAGPLPGFNPGTLSVNSGSANIAYVIVHDGGKFFTIDDLTADAVTGLPRVLVPEPSTMVLSSLMLIGIGAYARRKFKR